MMERVRELVLQIGGSALTLSSASAQMSVSLAQSRQGVERQLQDTEQVATAMHEMTATAQEVARNTASAASAAVNAKERAAQGRNRVAGTVEAISSLAANIGAADEVIRSLQQDAGRIVTVLDVIQGVAEQTNLLALNAAIEAARAGEQGRGFAVVADEVRSLARRTHDSTREIEQMVERLQSSSKRATEQMDNSRLSVQGSVEMATQADNALKEITAAVAQISDTMIQIASAAEEQTAVAHEINRGILAINSVTREGAEGTAELAVAGDQLTRLAGELKMQVSRFHT
jgi:methyl-accepting chemotaxis protein